MMRMMFKAFQTDLTVLGHLAREGERDLVRDGLLDIGAALRLPDDSADEWERTVNRLRASLKAFPELVALLDLHLLTRNLLEGQRLPAWFSQWLEASSTSEILFSAQRWRQATLGRWVAVPVLLTGDEVLVRYFIVGWMAGRSDLDLLPSWARTLLEDSAAQAVRCAAGIAKACLKSSKKGSFFCYPLTVANQRTQFNGISLGLGLALGFLQASSGEPLSSFLACSGGLGPDGRVAPVGQLAEKFEGAENHGFKVFMFPASQSAELPARPVELLPVTDIAEAWMLARLYSPGNSRELLTLAGMLKDPCSLVNNLELVEPRWIEWAHQNGKLDGCLPQLLKSGKLLELYVHKVQDTLDVWKLDAAEIYSRFLPVAHLKHAISGSPLAAFRFCAARLDLCNHRGDIAGADEWAAMAKSLLSYARKADVAAAADFLNKRFISLHNRYVFQPKLPRDIRTTLACLEARYRAQCDGGGLADRALAALYGSIAQNFGFCGPNYLKSCEEYAGLAFQAFGNMEVAEYAEDLLRQCACLVYACLDAGKFNQACEQLFFYLGVHSWQDLQASTRLETLSRWQHAALARYLADAGEAEQKVHYLKWVLEQDRDSAERSHPWQLWANNLGRIASELGELDAAAEFFHKSLNLCRAKAHGPTVRVMALLPLAGLNQIGRRPDDIKSTLQTIRQAAQAVNPDYFKMVLEKSDDEVLEEIRHRPQTLFPFSYR
jgi:hypothetical protein